MTAGLRPRNRPPSGAPPRTGSAPRPTHAAGTGITAEQDVRQLWSALEEVMDPEIPISLVDLGLIYAIRRTGGEVDVDLTFTATACPCMAFIRFDIEERLRAERGVDLVRIHEVWNPPWTKDRVTEKGRAELKKLGVSL